jgi:phosphoadenosine phosphosulfate reductase
VQRMIDPTAALAVIAAEMERAEKPCITSSFQADGVVLLHMLRQFRHDIPVLFLDTVHHFAETIRYRDEMAEAWGLNLVTLRATEPAPGLWQTSTQACCGRHKVEPLFAALRNYDTWFTGLRRDQSASRAGLQEVEAFDLDEAVTLRKVSPLVEWSSQDVRRYAADHGIPLLPLYDRGYTSIGCEPCTSLPLDALNPRSGRWSGEKQECGIHLQHSERAACR